MAAYYNEFEPYAAEWLRNLIKKGLIPDGEVDTRSIVDVAPDDLRGFTQCHFFAGIGGWGHALRLAGWPDDRPIWTGSAPCQPFSVAGKGAAQADERHLWPVFFELIRACRPPVVMGEQVAAAVGKSWLDGVSADLEGIGYATGAAVVPACAVDAPHRRDRLWFVADANPSERGPLNSPCGRVEGEYALPQRQEDPGRSLAGGEGDVADAVRLGRQRPGALGGPGNTAAGDNGQASDAVNAGAGFWAKHRWAVGADGKARRVEPSICLLVDGVSNCLANVLSICEVASQRINDHAERSQTDPGEVLRMVRKHLYEGASGEEQSVGMCGKLYAPKVLLDFMLSQATACNRAANSSGVKKAGKETVAGAMRIMRMDGGFVHSPCQLQSDGQQCVQSSNPLHELSFLLACDTQAFGEAVFDAHAAINRVGMLRAYGNAIAPPLAAEIIMAFMEATETA